MEYRALPEKGIIGTDIEYQNKIMFNDFDVNTKNNPQNKKLDNHEQAVWIKCQK